MSLGIMKFRWFDDSVKWLSAIFFLQNNILAKRRFDEMTSRESDVAQKFNEFREFFQDW